MSSAVAKKLSSLQRVVAVALRLVLASVVGVVFLLPIMVKRDEFYVDVAVRDICGAKVNWTRDGVAQSNFTFEAFLRGGELREWTRSESMWRCLGKDGGGEVRGLGCLGNAVVVVDDYPASQMKEEQEGLTLLLKPGQNKERTATFLEAAALCSE